MSRSQFDEVYLNTNEQYKKLLSGKLSLAWFQVICILSLVLLALDRAAIWSNIGLKSQRSFPLGVPQYLELRAAAILSADGVLMFQQVPMVEIDGMKLVQTKAILNYIAEKYNLHGKDLKDRVMYGPFQ